MESRFVHPSIGSNTLPVRMSKDKYQTELSRLAAAAMQAKQAKPY